MKSVRERFEEIWPVPDGVEWNEYLSRYRAEFHSFGDLEDEWNLRLDTFTRCQETMALRVVDDDVERADFEAVCPYRIDRHNGVYESQRTQDGWNMWIYRARLGEIKK